MDQPEIRNNFDTFKDDNIYSQKNESKNVSNQQGSKQIERQEIQNDHNNFKESPYRWVIVALMGLMYLINGLGKNTIIPIASKIASIYHISSGYVSLPIIMAFVAFSVANIPANQIVDRKGLKVGFVIGGILYTLGLFFYALIGHGYYFAVIGSILFSAGQPFFGNAPAKIATYWFISKNRPLATSIMTGQLFFGIAVGFIVPTLVVTDNAEEQEAKDKVILLYSIQFVISAISVILVALLMKKKPINLPSLGAMQKKATIKEAIKTIRSDKNLWVLFFAYTLIIGPLLSLDAISNLILELYGMKQLQISIMVVLLLFSGIIGSICWSIYLKRTMNYRLTVRMISLFSIIIFLLFWLSAQFIQSSILLIILGALMGFIIEPIVPISYDLGCQLGFPIGEAQITGLLNGGSLIFTFFLTLLITRVFSFENKKDGFNIMLILTIITAFGALFFWKVKINLKRRQFERKKKGDNQSISEKIRQDENLIKQNIEMMNINEKNDQQPIPKQPQIQYKFSVGLEAFSDFINKKKSLEIPKFDSSQKYAAFQEQHANNNNNDQI